MTEPQRLDAADFGLPETPECPFCGGTRTHLLSPFGPQLSVASFWCRHCHTAFEYMKWKAGARPAADR